MFSIASLFPIEQIQERPHFRPKTTYILEACTERGNPFILPIDDQYVDDYVGYGRTFRTSILARDIVNDLWNAFANGIPGSDATAGPAIWIVEGPPTQADIEHYDLRQMRFWDRKVREARVYNQRGWTPSITRIHHIAAQQLGIDDEPWMVDQTMVPRLPCPFCAIPIPSTVAKCPNCKEVVNETLYQQIKERLAGSPAPTVTEPHLSREEMEAFGLDQDQESAVVVAQGFDPRAAAATVARAEKSRTR